MHDWRLLGILVSFFMAPGEIFIAKSEERCVSRTSPIAPVKQAATNAVRRDLKVQHVEDVWEDP